MKSHNHEAFSNGHEHLGTNTMQSNVPLMTRTTFDNNYTARTLASLNMHPSRHVLPKAEDDPSNQITQTMSCHSSLRNTTNTPTFDSNATLTATHNNILQPTFSEDLEEVFTDVEIDDPESSAYNSINPYSNGNPQYPSTTYSASKTQCCSLSRLIKTVKEAWKTAAWWAVLLAFVVGACFFGISYLVFAELRSIPSYSDVNQRCASSAETFAFIVNKEGLGLIKNVMVFIATNHQMNQTELETLMTISAPYVTAPYSMAVIQKIANPQRSAWERYQNTSIYTDSNGRAISTPQQNEYAVATLFVNFITPAFQDSVIPDDIYGKEFFSDSSSNGAIIATMKDSSPHLALPVRTDKAELLAFQHSPHPLALLNQLSSDVTVAITFSFSSIVASWIADTTVNYLLREGDYIIFNNMLGNEISSMGQSIQIQVLDRTWAISCYPIPRYDKSTYLVWSWIAMIAMILVSVPLTTLATLVAIWRARHAHAMDLQLRTSGELLSELKARSVACVHAIPNPMILLDREGRVVALSRPANALLGDFGASFLKDIRIHDIIIDNTPLRHPSNPNLFAIGTRQVVVRRPDGTTFPADLVVSEFKKDQEPKLAQILLLTDITEKCRVIARLEKAEADTRRAYTARSAMLLLMCYELKNPMYIVMAATEILLERLKSSCMTSMITDVQAIWTSANHVHSLIEDVIELLGTKQSGRVSVEHDALPLDSENRIPLLDENSEFSPLREIKSELPLSLQNSTCLKSWLEYTFQLRACMFDLKNLKVTYVLNASPNYCLQVSKEICSLIRKIIDQGYSMGEIGASLCFTFQVGEFNTQVPSICGACPEKPSSKLHLSMACSNVASLEAWLAADARTRNLNFDAVVQSGEDIFSIHNGSRGVAFSSAFTWPVLRKLIAQEEGESKINRSGQGVTINVVVPFKSQIAACVHTQPHLTEPQLAPTALPQHPAAKRTPSPPKAEPQGHAQAPEQCSTPNKEAPSPRRVLVVEDNLMVQRITKKLLENLNLEVCVAGDGQVAVDLMEKNENGINFIFMDLMMPVMDGYEAATIIHSKHPHIPIVALTANSLEDERVKCADSGNFVDFLTKPARKVQLASVLAKWAKPESS